MQKAEPALAVGAAAGIGATVVFALICFVGPGDMGNVQPFNVGYKTDHVPVTDLVQFAFQLGFGNVKIDSADQVLFSFYNFRNQSGILDNSRICVRIFRHV